VPLRLKSPDEGKLVDEIVPSVDVVILPEDKAVKVVLVVNDI
jgi:hypothetical protein